MRFLCWCKHMSLWFCFYFENHFSIPFTSHKPFHFKPVVIFPFLCVVVLGPCLTKRSAGLPVLSEVQSARHWLWPCGRKNLAEQVCFSNQIVTKWTAPVSIDLAKFLVLLVEPAKASKTYADLSCNFRPPQLRVHSEWTFLQLCCKG